jgi:V/A-type H+/Na+-transporting ATPase subunit K
MKAFTAALTGSGLALLATLAMAEEAGTAGATSGLAETYRSVGLGLVVALIMVGSILGASYAVGRIGSAVMGAAAEKPELLTRSLVFVALAEGLAVLGFAVAVMILQKI